MTPKTTKSSDNPANRAQIERRALLLRAYKSATSTLGCQWVQNNGFPKDIDQCYWDNSQFPQWDSEILGLLSSGIARLWNSTTIQRKVPP